MDGGGGGGGGGSPSSLTSEQRERIANQKRMAMAKLLARDHHHHHHHHLDPFPPHWTPVASAAASPSSVSPKKEIIFVEDDGGNGQAAEKKIQPSCETLAPANPNKSFLRTEVIEVEEEEEEDVNPTVKPSGGGSGWRSVKKRPFSGNPRSSPNPNLDSRPSPSTNLNPVSRAGPSPSPSPSPNPNPNPKPGPRPSPSPCSSRESEPVKEEKILLSKPQLRALKAIAQGKSVFITGSAGTGKSFVLGYAIRILRNAYPLDSVFVTASTGLAACALGGTTLHSFAGVGLGAGKKEALADRVASKREARDRWRKAKALIIDEISMIDGELFDKLEYVANQVRGTSLSKGKRFGGLQLIVTGDFFQLPPVQPENPRKYFAFEADCWNDCFDHQIDLCHVFRQSDSEFISILNELRRGSCSDIARERLQSCSSRPVHDPETGISLTRLYPHKVDVGRENEEKLNALDSNHVPFFAKDVGRSEFAMRQLENVRAEKQIALAIGAQVMLVKNIDTSAGLCNGSRGVVVGFVQVDDPQLPNGEHKQLAKAITPAGLWPRVRFACDQVERTILPESWTVLEGDLEIAKRSQIPLILAWALSVHKCQGMTLDRVETDLSRAFDYGMVYVALSRVKSLDGLRLLGFNPAKIKVHPHVVQFYNGLKSDL